MKRVHVEVTGTVQGVFFRDTMRREATSRDVVGWVANTTTGTVEAELEGEDDAVDAVVDWCRAGSPQATVEHVEVTPLDPRGDTGFQVR